MLDPRVLNTGTPAAERRPTDPVPLDPLEDEWIRRATRGDQDAFTSLVDRHGSRVFSLALRIMRNDREAAADMTQEVFLRAFRGLGEFTGGSRFSTWLHRIAVNACVTEQRKRRALKRTGRTVSLDAPVFGDAEDGLRIEPVARDADPAASVSSRELDVRLRAAVDELPDDMRIIVTLRDLQDLSYEEIAETLDVPIGTVRSRLHRARATLRLRLEGLL
jgi:RNA polymerase sigma-70 factor (ECF subfamily)